VLVELSVVEQRYHAVMEVGAGVPVTEVAARYGVSRQSVHTWIKRYQDCGLSGLADRSHRPASSPLRIDARVEALICRLRREHPAWGPRRLVFEVARREAQPVPSRSTVYRVLVRNGLITPQARRRARSDYRRWERGAAMELWQMDIVGGIMLADGSECKVVTGIDDHSRFVVCAAVVARATGRAVCAAFVGALERFGVPGEVLTDNGKQFTGRFASGRAAEVMFERICRENGITARHTKPRSPTTTGKIERWHQSLRRELLDVHGPFKDLAHAQAAIDGWVAKYNTARPHQGLDMAVPASRFGLASALRDGTGLGLRVPPALRPVLDPEPVAVPVESATAPAVSEVMPAAGAAGALLWAGDRARVEAVEVDRVVPASGDLWICGQQVWFGPAHAGRPVTLWIDTRRMHILIGGQRHKTLPSKISGRELRALLAAGKARPAGAEPVGAAGGSGPGGPMEVERTVNAVGLVGLGGKRYAVGNSLAGLRVTLRLDGTVMHVLGRDRALLATLPCPLPAARLGRLQSAHPAGPPPSAPQPGPASAERIVSAQGTFVIAGQKVTLGMQHARAVVQVVLDGGTIQVFHGATLIRTVARTSDKALFRRRYNENKRDAE
jgi:transposase InsO family protein